VPLPPEEEVQTGLPMGADKEEKEVYIQKRMVDFVKRRVLVLEKVLNAEYQCMGGEQVQPEELPPQMMMNESGSRFQQAPHMQAAYRQPSMQERAPAPPRHPVPICES